ncbi:MAG: hypothetical protein ACRC5T_11025 [Cetobacterium sp.]
MRVMAFDFNTGLGNVADLIKTVVTRVVKDPQQQAEISLKIEELKQTGELAQLANDTKLYEIEVDDRKSARTINSNFVDFLAIAVIVGATFILYQILFGGLNDKISDMTAGMIIGVFTTAIGQVLAYYFGSSSGSKAKNDAINKALSK